MIRKKICMLGAFAVGKTSLVSRYVTGFFTDNYHTTVGVRIDSKDVVANDQNVKLMLWDLYGEDDFQKMRTSYLRGAAGLIYVVDGTRPDTVATALDMRRRAEEAIGRVPTMILANKSDLEPDWEIDASVVDHLAAQADIFHKTSAKTGNLVNTAFEQLTARILTS